MRGKVTRTGCLLVSSDHTVLYVFPTGALYRSACDQGLPICRTVYIAHDVAQILYRPDRL